MGKVIKYKVLSPRGIELTPSKSLTQNNTTGPTRAWCYCHTSSSLYFQTSGKSWKNKRNKKSGARGIRTPDLRHEETKSACVATGASYLVVYETPIIKYKINSALRFEICAPPPMSSSSSSSNNLNF